MIDIHCHMLPGIDDGARDLDSALAMARLAVEDGITHTVCTPHIYPGLFENTVEGIRAATEQFRLELKKADIPLEISFGADIQIVPELIQGLERGSLPCINNSRYFLFEPPHHVSPPGMLDLLHNALSSGFVPIITHPERLTYIGQEYDTFIQAAEMGAWIQLTAGSLGGTWGRRVQAITERFLRDGVTHIIASDAHNLSNRTPQLSIVKDKLHALVGEEETEQLLAIRPGQVINNAPVSEVSPPNPQAPAISKSQKPKGSWLGRLFGR